MDGPKKTVDRRRLRIELAGRDWKHRDLAHAIGVAPNTLSGWLCGLYSPPYDWIARIETALQLEPGSLAAPAAAEGGSR